MAKVKKIQVVSINENIVVESIYDIFGENIATSIAYRCKREDIVQPHCCHSNSWQLVLLLQNMGYYAQAVEGYLRENDFCKLKHVFNRVKIDGKWRYFDITLDVLWEEIEKGIAIVGKYYALRGLNSKTLVNLFSTYHYSWFTCLGSETKNGILPAFDDNGTPLVGDFAFSRFVEKHPFLLELDSEKSLVGMCA